MTTQNVILTNNLEDELELIPYTGKPINIGDLKDVEIEYPETGRDRPQFLIYNYGSENDLEENKKRKTNVWINSDFPIEQYSAKTVEDDGLVDTKLLNEELKGKADKLHDHAFDNISGNLDVKRLYGGPDGKNKILSSLLPGTMAYVVSKENFDAFPEEGDNDVIYVANDTNKTYRWVGKKETKQKSYVEISQSLALGETSASAFRGDLGSIAWHHSLDESADETHMTDIYPVKKIDEVTTPKFLSVAYSSQGHILKTSIPDKDDVTSRVRRFREDGYDGDGLVKAPVGIKDTIHYLDAEGNFTIPKIGEIEGIDITNPAIQDIISCYEVISPTESKWKNIKNPIMFDTNNNLNVPDNYKPIFTDDTGTNIITTLTNINNSIENLWTKTHLNVETPGTGNAITKLYMVDGSIPETLKGEMNITFFNYGGELSDITKVGLGKTYKWTGSTITVGDVELENGNHFIYVDSNKIIKFGGDAKWGSITGNIDDQIDLKNKLDNKANVSTTLSGYGITDAYNKSELDTELATKADKATTLSGYGIIDAYTKTETDTKLDTKSDKSTTVTHTVNTAVGSTTQPIYITTDGIATATSFALNKTVPSDAKFTDTTYTSGTNINISSTNEISATVPTKTSELTNDSNFGTISEVKMNGSSKGTTGVVDLGTVITAHQDISGKQDILPALGDSNKPIYTSAVGTISECTIKKLTASFTDGGSDEVFYVL